MVRLTQKIVGAGCISLAFLIAVIDCMRHEPESGSLSLSSNEISLRGMSNLSSNEQIAGLLSNRILGNQEEESIDDDENPSAVQNDILQLGRGETLKALLVGAGVSPEDAQNAVVALGGVYNPKNFKSGQDINITSRQSPDGEVELLGLSFNHDLGKSVEVERTNEGTYKAKKLEGSVAKDLKKVVVSIQSSLFSSAVAKGVPPQMLTPLIQAFSYDIDFQRDVKKGDKFEIVYEIFRDRETGRERTGNVIYASVTPHSKSAVRLYRFDSQEGKATFYNERGESIRKALMRTPINGAKISSHFGKRRHPIQGFTKMHEGVDFAAPKGTPIYAAGDGTVTKATRNRGLGNFVEIKHNKEFSTAYGHMSKFAKGIHPGKKISQGTVIGYVGSTGHSTGPHLHFELHKNGAKINPQSIKTMASGKLEGKALKKFLDSKHTIDRQIAKLADQSHMASAEEAAKDNKDTAKAS